MKNLKRILSVFVAVVMVASLATTRPVAAAGPSLSISPASQQVTRGASFTVQVRGNADFSAFLPGTTSGKINFPSSLLRVTSTSTGGSSYSNMTATPNNTSGTVSFSGSASPAPSGALYLFSVTFTAIAGGTAQLSFSQDSVVNNSIFYNTAPTTSGGTYTIVVPTCPAGQTGTPPNCTTPPAPTCPAGQTGTPPNCTTPRTTTPSTPSTPQSSQTQGETNTTTTPPLEVPEDTAPVQTDSGDLSIRNVTVQTGWKENKIQWTPTLNDVTSTFEIGLSKSSLKKDESVSRQEAETETEQDTFIVSPKDLTPGTRYYYRIAVTAQNDENKKAIYSGAFTTKGYPVILKVTTSDNEPSIGSKIQVDGSTYTTDKNGTIALELANKKFNATIEPVDGDKQSVTFTVAKKTIPSNGSSPDVQTFSFTLAQSAVAEKQSSSFGLIAISGAILLLLLLSLIGFLLYRRRKAEQQIASIPVVNDYPWSSPQDIPAPPQMQYTEQVDSSQQTYEQVYAEPTEQYVDPYAANQPSQDTTPQVPTEQPPYQAQNIEQVHSLAETQNMPAEYPPQEDIGQLQFDDNQAHQFQPEPEQSNDNYDQYQNLALPAEETPLQTQPSSAPEYTEMSQEVNDLPNDVKQAGAIFDPSTGELDIVHDQNHSAHRGAL